MSRGAQLNQVQTVTGFLNPAECQRLRQAMNEGTLEAGEVLEEGFERRDLIRRVSNVEVAQPLIALVEHRLDNWRPTASKIFGVPLSAREGSSFLRYEPGGFYRPHRDQGQSASWPDAARRRIALVVFLGSAREIDPSGEFRGGILRFLEAGGSPMDVHPQEGMLVAFRATELHEVTIVEGGVRDAVVDWFY